MTPDGSFKTVLDKNGLYAHVEKDVAGVVHQFVHKKGIADRKAFSEAKFIEKDRDYLTLRCAISVQEEIAILDIKDDSEISKVILDFSKYDKTHNIFISGKVRGRTISAVLDPRTNSYTGDTIALDKILKKGTLQKLATFSPIFQDAKLKFDAMRKPHEDVINRTINNSRWKSVGRAACWGFAGLGAAAACAAGFGVGCAAGAFVFGAAASVCNDQFKE